MINLIDIHTHSVLSTHAYSTILENVKQAKKVNLNYYGISDHAPGMPGGMHLYAVHNLKILPKIIEDVHVLKGVEVNIMNEQGDLDLLDEDMSSLDYAIASIHGPCFGSSKGQQLNTEAYLNAMANHPCIKVLGHIDDARQPVDFEVLAKSCADNEVLIEINNSSLRPESFRVGSKGNVKLILEACMRNNTPVILTSDAHIYSDVGRIDYALMSLKEVNFPDELVVNYSHDLIQKYFITKKV